MDYHAKRAIFEFPEHLHSTTKAFPLESISIFMDKNKLTSDKGDKLRFWAHKQIAKTYFYEAKILFEEFDLIDWESIYAALHTAYPDFSKYGRASKSWESPQQMVTDDGKHHSTQGAQAVNRSGRHAAISYTAITQVV
jgi:hypothetical protein